jgi:chromosomal replication initiator protein
MNSVVTIPLAGPALHGEGFAYGASSSGARRGASSAASDAHHISAHVRDGAVQALQRKNHRTGQVFAATGAKNIAASGRGPSLPAFMAGPENRLANVALSDVLNGAETTYSPLYFYGPAGCGKTHLACGLVQWWEKSRPDSSAYLLSGAEFAEHFAAAVDADRVAPWRQECREAGLFVLEDVSQLAGKRPAQNELCHTLDALDQAGALIVVTGRALPGQTSGLVPTLCSRLSAGLAVPLALPGAGARRMIVESLAAARRMNISRAAACLLADSIAGSVPTLVATLLELEAESGGAEVDMQQVRAFITQRTATEPPTLRSIAMQTAKYFHLTLAELKSPLRRQALVTARGVAFVLARQLTDKSLEQIGAYFGGRDHTTVLHACRRTEKLSQQDATLRQAIADLKRGLA